MIRSDEFEELSHFLDGELAPAESARLEAQLETRPELAAARAQIEALGRAGRALPHGLSQERANALVAGALAIQHSHQRWRLSLGAASVALLLAGASWLAMTSGPTTGGAGVAQQINSAPSANEGTALEVSVHRILQKLDSDREDLPPTFVEGVKREIDRLVKAPDTPIVLQRKAQLWPIIASELARQGLPEEIGYVVWKESQFDSKVEGVSERRGLWQMDSRTARAYGLRVDNDWKTSGVDERVDPAKSTQAAARYLSDLRSELGSPLLLVVLGSYNGGENEVRYWLHKEFRNNSPHGFWDLYKSSQFPEPVRERVIETIAAAIIGSSPGRFGLQ